MLCVVDFGGRNVRLPFTYVAAACVFFVVAVYAAI